MLKDIIEKDIKDDSEPPKPTKLPIINQSGFPQPKRRTNKPSSFKSSRNQSTVPSASTSTSKLDAPKSISNLNNNGINDIDTSNRSLLDNMSQEEILQEKEDIEAKLGPDLVEFIKNRSKVS